MMPILVHACCAVHGASISRTGLTKVIEPGRNVIWGGFFDRPGIAMELIGGRALGLLLAFLRAFLLAFLLVFLLAFSQLSMYLYQHRPVLCFSIMPLLSVLTPNDGFLQTTWEISVRRKGSLSAAPGGSNGAIFARRSIGLTWRTNIFLASLRHFLIFCQ